MYTKSNYKCITDIKTKLKIYYVNWNEIKNIIKSRVGRRNGWKVESIIFYLFIRHVWSKKVLHL